MQDSSNRRPRLLAQCWRPTLWDIVRERTRRGCAHFFIGQQQKGGSHGFPGEGRTWKLRCSPRLGAGAQARGDAGLYVDVSTWIRFWPIHCGCEQGSMEPRVRTGRNGGYRPTCGVESTATDIGYSFGVGYQFPEYMAGSGLCAAGWVRYPHRHRWEEGRGSTARAPTCA